jgi:hypothetical protein
VGSQVQSLHRPPEFTLSSTSWSGGSERSKGDLQGLCRADARAVGGLQAAFPKLLICGLSTSVSWASRSHVAPVSRLAPQAMLDSGGRGPLPPPHGGQRRSRPPFGEGPLSSVEDRPFASTATRRYKRPAVEAGLPANYYRSNINEQGRCDDHPWPHARRRFRPSGEYRRRPQPPWDDALVGQLPQRFLECLAFIPVGCTAGRDQLGQQRGELAQFHQRPVERSSRKYLSASRRVSPLVHHVRSEADVGRPHKSAGLRTARLLARGDVMVLSSQWTIRRITCETSSSPASGDVLRRVDRGSC